MDLLAVFAAAPEFTVVHGREELGAADAMMLTRKIDGPRLLALAGRAWRVNHIDWRRRRCHVEPADDPAHSRWHGQPQPHSYQLCQAKRHVLLGADPDAELSKRAVAELAKTREQDGHRAAPAATVIEQRGDDLRWWTWAGGRGNATLAAALPHLVDEPARLDNHSLRLRPNLTSAQLRAAIDTAAAGELPAPEVTDEAIRELKFGEALPPELAAATLAMRLTDEPAARAVLAQRLQWAQTARSNSL
jgi:ATP-dependent Lhr-like helicase